MSDHSGATFVSTQRHDTYPTIDPTKTDLSGKVVLVTGASKGIGKAIALAFSQSGVRGLVLLARSDLSAVKAECLAAQRSGRSLEVLTAQVDVAKNEEVVAAVKTVEETFGRLDVVINNAGYLAKYSSITDSDPEDWWTTWNINIRGTYHVVRAALPLLIKCDGDKTVINVSSMGGNVIFPRYSSYGPSKFALLRFSEFIDAEYSDEGVLAYSIHPGSILTDMGTDVPEEYKHFFVDTVELAAHTTVWLTKDRREWLSGRFVSCTWDMEELLEKKEEIIQGDKLKAKLVV